MVPMDVGSFDFHAVERAIEALGWSGEVRWACTNFDRLWGFGRSDFSGDGGEDDRSVAFGGDYVMVPMDVGSFDFHAVERAIEALGWSGEVRWACTNFDRLWGFGRSDFSGDGGE